MVVFLSESGIPFQLPRKTQSVFFEIQAPKTSLDCESWLQVWLPIDYQNTIRPLVKTSLGAIGPPVDWKLGTEEYIQVKFCPLGETE